MSTMSAPSTPSHSLPPRAPEISPSSARMDRRASEDDIWADQNIDPSKVNVLVVDDEIVTRSVLSNLLRQMHFNVTCAEGGRQAQEILSREKFHVILLDIFMPDVDGYELLKFLKQAYTQDVSIIMMSGSEDPETVTKAFQGGAEDFLQKPIRQEVLQRRINLCLEDRERRRKEKMFRQMIQKERIRGDRLSEQMQEKEKEILKLKTQVSEAVETPIQVVMHTVGDLMQGDYGVEEYKNALYAVIKSLGSSDLYRPAFAKLLTSKENQIDATTRQWLMSEFTHQKESIDEGPRKTSLDGRTGNVAQQRQEGAKDGPLGSSSATPWDWRALPQEFMTSVRTFNFDASKWTSEQLMCGVVYMLHDFDVLQAYRVSLEKLWAFLNAIRQAYRTNPYHNFTHAMDVTQFSYACLCVPKISQLLTIADVFALLLSAIIHDTDHPGLNNNYQVNAVSDLALLYNDISVLENYHVSFAFKLLRDPKYNVLENLSSQEFKELRRAVVSAVLATDMANHFEFVSKFQTRIATTPLSRDSKDDRQMLINFVLKCSDISNVCRPFAVAKSWAENLVSEFVAQGDRERSQGMPVSPFMDRETIDKIRMQVNFIDFVAGPMYKAFLDAFTLADLSDNIQSNRAQWANLLASSSSSSTPLQPAAAVAPPQQSQQQAQAPAAASPSAGAAAPSPSPTPVKIEDDDPNMPAVDIETGIELSGGEPEFFQSLLLELVETGAKQIANARDGYKTGRFDVVHRESHSLKGASSTLGAIPVSKAALLVEKAAKTGEHASVPALLDNLEKKFEKLRIFVEGMDISA